MLVGFAGMTHLGINSAVATAERGNKVLCYDANSELISNLNQHKLSIIEPQLPELLAKNNVDFTDDIKKLTACDIVYISPDVPTNDQAQSDLSSILTLIEAVAAELNANALLVILCQVPPGFTRTLNKYLPLQRVYYQVETLIFGRAIERALYPERFIIGCFDPKEPIDARFDKLLKSFACPILPMRYESAELAKISINCCLVASVSVANTLSEICENIGADWAEIVPALKLDKRIGPNAYLAAGLGLSGGNLERDLATIINLGNEYGAEIGVIKSWIRNSQHRKNWVLKILHEKIINKISNPIITVLGVAYKENTHSIKNSPSVALLNCLQQQTVQVYDPVVSWDHKKDSIEQALKNADVLVVMTPWSQFKDISIQDLKKYMRGNTIIDPYKIFNAAEFTRAGFYYFTLGMNVYADT